MGVSQLAAAARTVKGSSVPARNGLKILPTFWTRASRSNVGKVFSLFVAGTEEFNYCSVK